MVDQPRILVVGDGSPTVTDWLRRCGLDSNPVHANSWETGLAKLADQSFDAIVANISEPALRDDLRYLVQSQHILAALPDGVALVDADLRIRLANPAFERWCVGAALGRDFYEALGASRDIVSAESCPFRTSLAHAGEAGPATVTTRLHCCNERDLDVQITPLCDTATSQRLLLVLARDVTARIQQQEKLDALHKAGRELAALSADQLAEMSVAERIELLKLNIRRFTRDLLHYEVIEIRLLDPRTGRLEPLLQEGMISSATTRVLLPSPEGQGVTGRVAATGKSYLCRDTAADPHYLAGSTDAHSSLTVPLIFQDKVIGTFNVESPRPNAFGAADLQFAEIFSHEIAAALHTLELLQVEKRTSASQSVEAISREVALPVDDILAAATSILERYIGHDAEMADKIRKIIVGARAIKQSIQKIGEDMGSPGLVPGIKEAPPPALKGMRVLVADNDDRVRRSAHGLLGRWGCIVETARDGQEALTMARLSSYDAILADIRLPDISGYEVYRRLREAQPQARVILMTGYGYDPTHALVKARQEGLRHVLFKPFRVDQLRDALSSPAPTPAPAHRSLSSDHS